MHALILAGGFATRLWPLTEARAKPLLPLAGEPMLTHLVRQLPEHIPVTVSTNASFADDVGAWASAMERSNLRIASEKTTHDNEKLGAMGATAQWIKDHDINDDILLLTGDNYLGFSLPTFLEQFKSGTALLAAHDLGDKSKASSFGTVLTKEDGRTITMFEEKPAEPKTSLVSTGISILPKETIPIVLQHAEHSPDNVGGIFETLLKEGHNIDCFQFKEHWFDVGSFEAYLEATKEIVGEHIIKGEDVHTEESELQGSIVIGARTTVRHSTLKNVVIFADCTIEDCHIEDCVIDDRCTLKGVDIHNKMIRAETLLERRA